MLLDQSNLFSDAQAVTASAASTNYIDLGETGTPANAPAAVVRDIGGENGAIEVLFQVTEAFATLTSLTVSLEIDDNGSFSSPTQVAQSATVAAADLVAGKRFSISVIPPGTDERYLRAYYTVAGSDATAGKVTASVVAGLGR